jgi:large subunit ribosomal protein L24
MAKGKKSIEPVKIKIRKNDQVSILTGKDAGKKGRVLRVIPKKNRLVVEGINFIKRHQRPTQGQQKGGVIEKENSIHISNVMLICPKCNHPTRISYQVLTDGSKSRLCKKCGEIMEK